MVHYRVCPYTMQEGALDLARAVRYVRSHADDYQIDEEDIAIIGFSAGGILCGEEVLHYDGFGIGREDSQWIIPFDEWLSNIFEN